MPVFRPSLFLSSGHRRSAAPLPSGWTDAPTAGRWLSDDQDLVDDPLQADALARRWQGPAQDEPPQPGLLLIDPVGGPGGAMLAALSRATGRTVIRSRLLSALGSRPLGTVEELTPALAAPGPGVVRCLRVRRLEAMVGSPTLRSLLSASDLVAVLSGALSADTMGRWAVGACAVARQQVADAVQGPRWLIFSPQLPRPWPLGRARPAWLDTLRFVQAGPVSQTLLPGVLWNHVLAEWVARDPGAMPANGDPRGCFAHLALRPAAHPVG